MTAAGEDSHDALTLLAALPIKGRAPKTGYDRSLFGPAWTDDVTVDGGHNGCDTRNDILRRDLTDIVVKAGTHDCLVLSGTLHDPYTGLTIEFTRGSITSQAVQIDHIVALSDAWQKGAQALSPDKLRDFANDPLNLQAVDGPTNARKQDGDAATWLPPNRAYRCTYVSRQVQVKAAYGLWVTAAERDAIERVLSTCPAASIVLETSSNAEASTESPVTSPASVSSHSAQTPAASPTAPPSELPVTSQPPPPAPPAEVTTPALPPPAPASCFPTSKAGNCYNAGQFCAKAHHGTNGVAGNGQAIRCLDDGEAWRWTNA